MAKQTGYELSRRWFDWCFVNPDKIKPIHTALYFFAIEHCNRLGWKDRFGLPTEMTKDAIGVKSWHTYIAAFNDLVEWGFFELIEKSKNQYSSNIIALSYFDEAHDEALDKATRSFVKKHQSTYQSTCQSTHQSTCQSTYQSNDSINKPITNKPITIKQDNTTCSPYYSKFDFHFLEEWAKDAFSKWLNYKFELKEPYKTQQAIEQVYKKLEQLSGRDPSTAIKVVNNVIEKEAHSLFELPTQKLATYPNQVKAMSQKESDEKWRQSRT